MVLLSYDIACKWFVNFFRRVEGHWPEHIKPKDDMSFTPVIPKLHDAGHKKTKNHEQFSCNLCKGIGHTDGECPERIWGATNPVANSTKVMGPGSRHDVLDDNFAFWNYEKYIGMGKTLMRRYRAAVPERNKQIEAHRGFTASLDSDDVAKWTMMCEDWESDVFPKTVANPYHVKGKNITQAQARRELAEDEESWLADGGVALHDTSPSSFLIMGLDLEDMQRRVSKLAKDHARGITETDGASLAEQRAILYQKIQSWRKVQAIYMPGLLQYLENEEKTKPGSTLDGTKAEEQYLWLPSGFPSSVHDKICISNLAISEDKLRTAQCHDSLSGLRDVLLLKSRMVLFK
ncbi:hypothetical protein GALMADRAFT_82182, partial [Galerina marginata CBS 339.88]